MSPRRYTLGKRSEESTRTRGRIVAAAAELFARDGFHSVSIDEIAEAADVARATVYNQFGSKPGLIEAIIQEVERSAGLQSILEAVAAPDATDALRQAVREGVRYWASVNDLARRLIGLGALDAEVRGVLNAADARRGELVAHVVDRLIQQGVLKPGLTRADAISRLGLICSFEGFDQVFTIQGKSQRKTASLLTGMATDMLL